MLNNNYFIIYMHYKYIKMDVLDANLQKIILLYLQPIYNPELKMYELVLNYCHNINPMFLIKEKEHFNNLTRIIKKYPEYNYIESHDVKKDCDFVGGRTLLDMLYTGSLPPYGTCTFSRWCMKI
jgi:hypothetical protein